MNSDDEFALFAKGMCIYLILCVLSVPIGLLAGQLTKYCMGL